ncbi:hypothetical protein [Streptomyces sp. NPDC051569]|uniref:hypothetical protein n=1 Tax=Streptomyces sp. NPDC051569 TaxID=3365661 RepID=UPI0037B04A6D
MIVEVGSGGAVARDAAGSGTRELTLSEGEFPSYREMLTALGPPRHRLIVDWPALLDAVGRCGEAPAISLLLGPDQAVVSRPDRSRATTLRAVGLGDLPLRIGFDPAVLAPALEAGIGPDVLLEVSAVTEPVVVRSADQGSFTTLVMPVGLTPTA